MKIPLNGVQVKINRDQTHLFLEYYVNVYFAGLRSDFFKAAKAVSGYSVPHMADLFGEMWVWDRPSEWDDMRRSRQVPERSYFQHMLPGQLLNSDNLDDCIIQIAKRTLQGKDKFYVPTGWFQGEFSLIFNRNHLFLE